jgi:hypothetical protein
MKKIAADRNYRIMKKGQPVIPAVDCCEELAAVQALLEIELSRVAQLREIYWKDDVTAGDIEPHIGVIPKSAIEATLFADAPSPVDWNKNVR